jgi:hypothetical protein
MSGWLASATAQIYFVLKIENLYESGVADASHLLVGPPCTSFTSISSSHNTNCDVLQKVVITGRHLVVKLDHIEKPGLYNITLTLFNN